MQDIKTEREIKTLIKEEIKPIKDFVLNGNNDLKKFILMIKEELIFKMSAMEKDNLMQFANLESNTRGDKWKNKK